MSMLVDLLQQLPESDIDEANLGVEGAASIPQYWPWDPDRFAQEQIRGLVRQVFLSGPKPTRQVVFSAVDDRNIAAFCMQVGEALSAQTPGSVCVVEASPRGSTLRSPAVNRERTAAPRGFGSLRESARQISNKLWLAAMDIFRCENENAVSGEWLRSTLRELRLEFDYTVFHGPPAGLYSETALLGQMSDGVVLLLQANSTRRVAAQKVIQKLHAVNVRLLGTVLNDRTFPIPEKIYRKL
jgi:hypothetical protein